MKHERGHYSLEQEKQVVENFLQSFPNYIIYEDESMLVINKPPGIPMSRGGWNNHEMGFTEAVQQICGTEVFPVHMLDMETSGIVVCGRDHRSLGALSTQFANRHVEKTYLTYVSIAPNKTIGIIAPLFWGKISNYKKAKYAATSFHPLTDVKTIDGQDITLLQVRIYTGRTHQIRAHLAELGSPICGDDEYGSVRRDFPRVMLHAFEIKLDNPQDNQRMTIRAPLPRDFISVLKGAKDFQFR